MNCLNKNFLLFFLVASMLKVSSTLPAVAQAAQTQVRMPFSVAAPDLNNVADTLPTFSSKQTRSPVLTVPARRAQGLAGTIVPIKVHPGFGQTLINFRLTGERVRQVTLGDSSKVTLSSDDPECLTSKAPDDNSINGAVRCNATVLYLKRIDLPKKIQQALIDTGLPTAPKTRLTVLTDNKNPYIFEIVYASGEPEYSVVAIEPDVTPERFDTFSVPQLNTFNRETLSRGYQVALERRTIPQELNSRITNFLTLIQIGNPVEQAASKSGISMQVVYKLLELGNSPQRSLFPSINNPWMQQPVTQ